MKRDRRSMMNCTVPLMTAVIAVLAAHATAQPAGVYCVDANLTTGNDDGTEWEHAWDDLQEALAFAELTPWLVDAIWVADGLYKPTTGSDRTVSFELVDGEAIYGGFRGITDPHQNWPNGEGDLENRDVHGNPAATLSGDIDANGSDDTYHVVTAVDKVYSTRIDGFTITGGNADAQTGLRAVPIGGGLKASCSSLAVISCTFQSNSAGHYYEDLLPRPTPGSGGGLYYHGLLPGQSSDCPDSYPLNVIDCLFYSNTAVVGDGGGLFNDGVMNVISSVFAHNVATVEAFEDLNHEWHYNDGRGGAIANEGVAEIENCTIRFNNAYEEELVGHGKGGGIYNTDVFSEQDLAGVTIVNSILWENRDGTCPGTGYTPTLAAQITSEANAYEIITFSDVQGITPGSGNINDDPLWATGTPFIYQLRWDSPCRDIGDDTSVSDDDFDADDDQEYAEENPDRRLAQRISGTAVDMGAYEHCLGDADDDGVVGVLDLLAVLAAWGATDERIEDVNGDEVVDVLDLLLVLADWDCGVRFPTGVPQDVQDCIDKYGDDIELMIGCIEAILLTEE